jgi:hypothetical protein
MLRYWIILAAGSYCLSGSLVLPVTAEANDKVQAALSALLEQAVAEIALGGRTTLAKLNRCHRVTKAFENRTGKVRAIHRETS